METAVRTKHAHVAIVVSNSMEDIPALQMDTAKVVGAAPMFHGSARGHVRQGNATTRNVP